MSARFSKLEAVDLADEEEDTEGEGTEDDCQVALMLPEGVRKGRRGTRRVTDVLSRGRKKLGSWRWVLLAAVSLAVAIFVALMVARLAREPPSHSDDANRLQGKTYESLHS